MPKDDSLAYKMNDEDFSNKESDVQDYNSLTNNDFYDMNDEDEWNEYFMKKKSRLRKQTKSRDFRNERYYYEDEW